MLNGVFDYKRFRKIPISNQSTTITTTNIDVVGPQGPSGEIDFDEFLTVIKEEQDNEQDELDDEVEGKPKKSKMGLGMLFGKEGVLRDLVAKKETFSALDLKKIANLNPNKNVGATKIMNKKESVQKIAQMFKGMVK